MPGTTHPISAPAWQPVGGRAPTSLVDARLQSHWAMQLLAAAADALRNRAADDSHTNATWSERHAALVGRPLGGGIRVGLRLADLTVLAVSPRGVVDAELPLDGLTVDDARQRLGALLSRLAGADGATLRLRDYDMPSHPVADGGRFAVADPEALTELARWFANADAALAAVRGSDARATEVAVWPHHYDAGGIVMLDADAPFESARQIGFGMSPGDGHIGEPYFYVTPFPIPDGAALPALATGAWHRQGFTGAVFTGSDVVARKDPGLQAELVGLFFTSAIDASLALVPGR